MKRGWTHVPLGELLEQDTNYVTTLESIPYKKLSVKLYGRGVVLDAPTHGDEVKMEKHQFAKSGQIIVSEIWAKKGALGIVPEEGEGALVTSHFYLFNVSSPRLRPAWVRWIFNGNYLESQLSAEAFGTTGYAAVRPSKFLEAKIPLPPESEQDRLASRLDTIATRLNQVQRLRKEAQLGHDALTISLHFSLAGGRTVCLGRLLRLEEEQRAVSPDGSYPQVGIRSFGLGLFKKPAVAGTNTTYRSFNVLRPGMFVMSQVKGWEGATSVCTEEFDGWFVSPEYRTFACVSGECDPGYLSHLVATSWFHRQLASATRGVGARRERVRPEMLLGLEMPFPTEEKQKEASKLLAKLRVGRELTIKSVTAESAILPSLLDQIFDG